MKLLTNWLRVRELLLHRPISAHWIRSTGDANTIAD